MKQKILMWLYRRYYDYLYQAMQETIEYRMQQKVARDYAALVASTIRSNPENKEWSSRFVSLENDYKALEKEVSQERVRNIVLARQVSKLLDFIV